MHLYILFFFIVTATINIVHGFQDKIQYNEIVQDTLQEYYESTLDNILGLRNEELLSELYSIIQNPHSMHIVLKSQAESILGSGLRSRIQDVCVAQLPSIIASQIHDLSKEMYSSVGNMIERSQKLSYLHLEHIVLSIKNKATTIEKELAIEDIGISLELFNLNMANQMIQLMGDFNMLYRIKYEIQVCQSIFEQDLKSSILTEKVWLFFLNTFRTNEHKGDGILNQYLTKLTSDIQSETYLNSYQLAEKVYEDLKFL